MFEREKDKIGNKVWTPSEGWVECTWKPERPEPIPDPALDAELSRQAEAYLQLGFHKILRMKEKDYVASLPHIKAQPKEFAGRFDIPVIVDPRIHFLEQCELAKVFSDTMRNLATRNWEKWKTPKVPYITWINNGKKNRNLSVDDVRKTLAPDERGATILDGLDFHIAYPNFLKEDQSIVFPGTSVTAWQHDYRSKDPGKITRFSDAPYIHRWPGGHRLDHVLTNFGYPLHRLLTCGVDKKK